MANNSRALELKANFEEYDQKLAVIKRLKIGLEKHLNTYVYFERCEPFTLARVIGDPSHSRVIVASVYSNGASFNIHDDLSLVQLQDRWSLELVRVVYDNMDVMIELAEELCKKVGHVDHLQTLLKRFDVEW